MALQQRMEWIDSARGLSMMAILLFHTEVYFTGGEIIPYNLYVCNSLLTFFFISGFLFRNPPKAFSLRRKLLAVTKGILLPYLIFTTAIAVPKSLMHDDLPMQDAFLAIATGHASWFVAALIVAEIILALLCHFAKGRKMVIFAACALPYLAIAAAYHFVDNSFLESINLWCWQNALMVLIFMFAGLHLRETGMLQSLSSKKAICIMAAALLSVKAVEVRYGLWMTLQPINVSSFALLLTDGLLGAVLILSVCQKLPKMRLVEYTGRHSLYYYFICGGVPLTVSTLLHHFGIAYHGNYLIVLAAFTLVYITATAIVYLMGVVVKNSGVKV